MRYLEHKHIIAQLPDKLVILSHLSFPLNNADHGAKLNRLALPQGGRHLNKRGMMRRDDPIRFPVDMNVQPYYIHARYHFSHQNALE
jgi:hypothetical protein